MSFRVACALTALSAFAFLQGPVRAHAAAAPEAPGASNFPQPSAWPQILTSTESVESVGPGVQVAQWSLVTSAGPLHASIATVDLRNPYVSLQVATQGNAIVGAGESLTHMADRLGAELGINADYFDINDSGAPLNLVVSGGRVQHAPDAAAVFAVSSKSGILMGPITYQLNLAAPNVVLAIGRVNDWSQSADVALVTPEFGSDKAFGATEVVLQPSGPSGAYTVESAATDLASLAILAPGQVGVLAHGQAAATISNALHPGEAVTMTQASQPALDDVSAAVGGGPLLLRDGQPVVDPAAPAPEETDVRNPVTGGGISADGRTLWLVVVDGRAPARSIGLTRRQFAALFEVLGASIAMAFDSGGSSEMVVRHLGEPQTVVVNTPSDGRERLIADGLFVVNSAPIGAAAKLLLDPSRPTPAILVGSTLQVQAHALDANDQPVPIAPASVTFSVVPADAGTIGSDGTLLATKPGPLLVSARLGQLTGTLELAVVTHVDSLEIVGGDQSVQTNTRMQLVVSAFTKSGEPIVVAPSAVTWRLTSGSGRLLPDGTYMSGAAASRDAVTAQVANSSASATLLVGDHAQMLQATLTPGSAPGEWSFGSRPAGLPGTVDATGAPDGSAALRLTYDFSTTTLTRAAYAQTSIVLPQQPIGLSIDVYGDGQNEWLRGGYKNSDGNDESLTIARHVDWRGWRTIRVAIPPQAAWPITWTRFYPVEPDKGASERGSLWFRNFTLYDAGPAS
ncbi:MAG TPA: phosphodiester glycosidase family protein [Candidatus Acidoferrales bacterium]|nr:phosphodiester glycosidase family protein [Candidatus Acidoferrales bacterium]